MKRCSGCKEWKSLDKFNKDNSRKDGCSRRCKECNKEVVRQWRIDNPGKITDSFKAYFHNWYLANKERMLEYNRMWVKSNPEKKRAKDRNRSANKRGAFGKMTLREWEELKEKYNYTCLCCKRREPEIELTHDHVLPISKGGANTVENSQPLCQSCNSSKGTKHIDYRG